MDLVSSIRKSGSRGGVNFSWDEVASSAHRENYLGHSLKAPVGRWQKGRDLTWYAKGDETGEATNETAEERAERQRKEEIKKIKEAEEDALARALGLPPPKRDQTGANAVDVGAKRRIGPEPNTDEGNAPIVKKEEDDANESKRSYRRHGDSERRHRRRLRSRSRSRERRRDRSPRRRDDYDNRGPQDDRRDRNHRHPRDASVDRRGGDRSRSPRRRDDFDNRRPKDERRDRRRRSYSRDRGSGRGSGKGRDDDRHKRTYRQDGSRSPRRKPRDDRHSVSPNDR